MLKLKLQYFGHLMQRTDSFEKTLMLEKIEGWRRRGQQDEMVGWHHWLNGFEFEQTPRVGDGQRGLACCSPWGHKDSDMTERLNWTEQEICNIFMRKLENTEKHKRRLEEIKRHFGLACLSIIKLLVLAKLIYKLNAISVKIPRLPPHRWSRMNWY